VTAQRFFIVRIMKTGTMTLVHHVRNNFGSRDVYPTSGIDMEPGDIRTALDISNLLHLSTERQAEIRVYINHYPYIAYQMLGIECVTATILREPVARIASHLRHAKRQPRFRDHSIEQIYEDPFFFGMFLHNHHTQNFSMTEADPLNSMMDIIEIDDHRLARAKVTLEEIDLLGLQEEYGEFLDALRDDFGWSIQPSLAKNVSTGNWEPSAAMRRKIEADNSADIELYEYARALYQRRRGAHSR
jgi:hypothetical protein